MTNENQIDNSEKVIVRYPPSPTGYLHIGNIRSLLFNYLFAKNQGGDVVMRFEDTDRERSSSEFEAFALETLSDLGLGFDRGPFRQSDRTEFYVDAIETLMRNDMAYEAEESKDGSGEKVIRFRNPNKEVTFTDVVRGEITIDSTDFGDFVIARSKTNPIYHLTVVVDDIDMGVSHVIRGEDHITSTPRQILLIEALGGIVPKYAHMPLIVGDDKKKLGKRHGAVTWKEFKDLGYLPEAVVNYIALLGWNEGKGEEKEIYSKEELIDAFSLERINKSPATFSYTKLDDINKQWMLKMDDAAYKTKVLEFLSEEMRAKFESDAELAERVINLVIKERLQKFSELAEMEEQGNLAYFFDRPEVLDEMIVFKDGTPDESKAYLKQVIEKIKDVSEEDWNAENIKELLWVWTDEVGRGQVLHPMRVSLSGAQRSPDPFTLCEVLGKEESLCRLEM